MRHTRYIGKASKLRMNAAQLAFFACLGMDPRLELLQIKATFTVRLATALISRFLGPLES